MCNKLAKVDFEQWNGFEGRLWKEEVNVRDFIQNNYTQYDGDEEFLEGPTEATNRLWGKLQELQKAERVAPKKKPVDLSAVADALKMYDGLSRTGKKEFWSRTVSKIVITNEDDFFVCPTSP